jgi:hypothetical protein
MDAVLMYSPGPQGRNLLAALSDFQVRTADSLPELARLLVGEPGVLCLVLQPGKHAPEDFLESLKACYPLLPVFLAHQEPTAGELEDLAARVGSLERTERRGKPRFDWPLQGSLSLAGAQAEPYDLRALSSGGAFLRCEGPCPQPGSRGRLRVRFRNFSLETACEVLDTRRASSRLPDGFAVRFTELGAEAQALLDRIVRDALIRAILEPESEPTTPSLGAEELLPGGFQPL